MVLPAMISAFLSLLVAPQSLIDERIPLTLRGPSDRISGTSRPGFVHFSVLKKGETPYACEVVTPPTVIPVKANDTLYFTFVARCLAAQNESQTGAWDLRVQRPTSPWDSPYNSSASVGKECRRVATRYEKLAVHFLAMVKIAMIRRLL